MKSKIVNISLPTRLLSKADRIAKEEYRTRSEVFREALRGYVINRQGFAGIYRYGAKQAEKNNIKPGDINRLISEYRQGK